MLEKHALARTALAYDSRDLAFVDFQIDLIENGSRTESFGHIFEFD